MIEKQSSASKQYKIIYSMCDMWTQIKNQQKSFREKRFSECDNNRFDWGEVIKFIPYKLCSKNCCVIFYSFLIGSQNDAYYIHNNNNNQKGRVIKWLWKTFAETIGFLHTK